MLQELFQSEYFCSTQNAKFFDYAISSLDNELFSIFSNYCKKNNIVIPISFFEKQGQNYFNSLIVIDSHGKLSEVYRKSHIPDGQDTMKNFISLWKYRFLKFLKLILEILVVVFVGINGFLNVQDL